MSIAVATGSMTTQVAESPVGFLPLNTVPRTLCRVMTPSSDSSRK